MRKLLLSLVLTASVAPVIAQVVTPPTTPPTVPVGTTSIVTVYDENFDPPTGPNLVTTGHLGTVPPSNPNNRFNDTNYTSVSAPMSFHSQVQPFDTVIFTTTPFATTGNTFIQLQFYHKCIVSPIQRAKIQVSANNGVSWTTLTSTHYQGASTGFPATGWFNQASYPADTTLWGAPTRPAPGKNPTAASWVLETFNISAIAANATNVLVRFRLEQAINVPAQYHGWFIDDVKVTAAPCELTPPSVSFNLTAPVVPAYVNQPTGAQYQINQKIGLEATDGSGIDSVRLYFNVNDTAWTRVTMAPTGSNNRYEYTILGLDDFDTVYWYTVVYDGACPNYSRSPSLHPTVYKFWKDETPPVKCGQVVGSSFPTVITSFPWAETFEGAQWVAGTGNGNSCCSHRGTFPTANPFNWTVAPSTTNSQFGWSIRNGAAPTTTTGPTGNHTPGGSKYIYLESSGANPPTTSTLETMCLDLTDPSLGCIALEFWYHMFGSTMGNLRVDIDTGSSTASYVLNEYQIFGQQQGAASGQWQKAFVPLDAYLGKIIRIRFTARKLLAGDNSDMAIDDIRVYEPNPVDMEMVSFANPQNGFCGYTNAEPVEIVVRNQGCNSISNIPVAYRLNGVTTWDTINQTLAPGDTTAFTFTTPANLSAYTTHNIRVFTGATGDAVNTNDTIGPRLIEHNQPLNTFPYVETFDGAGWTPGSGTAANPGTFGSIEWTPIPANTTSNFSWHVGTKLTPSNQTGPSSDYSRTGNYLYTEGDFGSTGNSAVLLSRCVDLTSLTSPTLDFMYHIYGANVGGLIVQIKPAGSNNYIPLGTFIPATQTDEFDKWNFVRRGLIPYAGTVIQLRIVAQKGTTAGSMADIAIDNLQIFDRIANDVGVVNITIPGFGLVLPSTTGPTLELGNFGTATITSFPVSVTVTPDCGGAPQTYTATYTGSISSGQTVTWVFPTAINWTVGSANVCASTTLTSDTHAWNNSHCKRTTPFSTLTVPFFFNFDNCAYSANGWYPASSGADTYRFWEVGNPGGTGGHSGTNAWVTNASGNYRAGADEVLRVPNLVGFDSLEGTQLRFWQKFNFSDDAGVLEYFGPGGWTPLGDASIQSDKIGWYDDPNIGSATAPGTGNPAWVGTTNGNWIYSQYPLGIMNNNASPLALRFRLVSGASSVASGWAIDDVEIYVPPQNSAAPIGITTVQKLRVPGTQTMVVRIENTGAKSLDSCKLRVWVDNTLLADKMVNFNPPLLKGQSITDTLYATPWVNATSGPHNICAYTYLPDSRLDAFPQDDSLCVSVPILTVVNNLDTNCYSDDFDSGLAPWYTANAYTYDDGLTSWEQGTPSQAFLNNAFSGSNAWMTNLNGNYKSRDSSALFSPVFEVDSVSNYELTFMHKFKTERFHDGGVVEVTLDGGISWLVIGFVGPNWFNTQYVTGLEVTKPGWTYVSNGWVQAKTRFNFDLDPQNPGDYPGKAILRFRFGSDQGIEDEGWAIDNFCIRKTLNNPIFTIGDEEYVVADQLVVGNLMPNPTTGVTYLPVQVLERTQVTLAVTTLMGQTVIFDQRELQIGDDALEIQTANLPSGIYLVNLDINGQRISQKLVVNK